MFLILDNKKTNIHKITNIKDYDIYTFVLWALKLKGGVSEVVLVEKEFEVVVLNKMKRVCVCVCEKVLSVKVVKRKRMFV